MHPHSVNGNALEVRLGASVVDARGHMCAFFRNRDEEYRVLLPFIKEGFERGDRAFHIVDPERRDEHVRRLREAGIDVAAAEARGQLDLRDWAQAHLREGLRSGPHDRARRGGHR